MRIMADNNPDTGSAAGGCAVMQNPSWTLAQVCRATGGKSFGRGYETLFRAISIDSRRLCPGDLFVAIRGDRFDGHDFVSAAVGAGAGGVMLSLPPAEELPVPWVLVADTLTALGDLAAFRRRQMPGLTVLAITGSSGKTTVKEMVAGILAVDHTILKTVGNFNNLVGLPLSLLPVDLSHRFAVLEMGMNRPGEIARLTAIAAPDIACVNNVQAAHLSGLGDISGVAAAKGELFRGLSSRSTMVVNNDDPEVRKLAAVCGQKKITFGFKPGAMVRATHLRNTGGEGTAFSLLIDGRRHRLRTRVVGRHNVGNCLAAAALALAAGVDDAVIVAGLAAFTPFAKRLVIVETAAGIRLIDDTYNANPASMLAALLTLGDLKRGRRAVVVVGDMLELGEQSPAAHRFLGESVARMKFDYLFAHGEFAAEVTAAAVAAGMDRRRAVSCERKDDITGRLLLLESQGRLGPGDWILVKGSRSMRMETIIKALEGGKG